jgi:hypothetical protein
LDFIDKKYIKYLLSSPPKSPAGGLLWNGSLFGGNRQGVGVEVSGYHTLVRSVIMDTIGELLRFLLTRKKYWMLPAIIILLLLSLLIVLSSGSVVAPFIYTIF